MDVDLPPGTLQTLIALKSKMISNLHITQTRVMYYLKLIKSYPCTTYFISELGFRYSEHNQTIVLSVGKTSMSWQLDLK